MSTRQQQRPEDFSISVARDGDWATVRPCGDLDIASADLLESEVRALRDEGYKSIVVDLREVRFLDSMGLRTLVILRNDAKRNGGRLELVPGPRGVQRIFELTAARGLFDWRPEG